MILPPRFFLSSVAALCCGFSIFPLVAQDAPQPQLLADLNRDVYYAATQMEWVLPVPGGVVFPRSTLAEGQELWFSDGTPQGSKLLKVITPGAIGSKLENGVQTGSRVSFTTGTGSAQTKLWFTDGTEAGTVLALDAAGLQVDGGPGRIRIIGAVEGGVLFRLHPPTPSKPGELWFSDGTTEGTRELAMLEIGFQAGFGTYREKDGLGYFMGGAGMLWRSDGTVDGTIFLVDAYTLTGGTLYDFTVTDSKIFLNVEKDSGNELWVCSLEGTDAVRVDQESWEQFGQLAPWGDRIVTQVYTESDTWELWVSDGTAAGTQVLPLAAGKHRDFSSTGNFTELKGWLYFTAVSPEAGTKLWRTNGTAAGTRVVPMPGAWSPEDYRSMFSTGDRLYFYAAKNTVDSVLWSTDGTTKGLRQVYGPNQVEDLFLSHRRPAFSGGQLFVVGVRSLWATKVKGNGLMRLTTPEVAGNQSAWPWNASYAASGNRVVGIVWPDNRPELWSIDPAGRARALWRSKGTDHFNVVAELDGKVLFADNVQTLPCELWITNGTGKGAKRLAKFGQYQEPSSFKRVGDKIFFRVLDYSASDYPKRPKLWVTDGTPKGTRQVLAWDFTEPGPLPDEIVEFQGNAYFMAQETTNTLVLWRSDGTPDGTRKVKTIPQAYLDSGERVYLKVIGARLSFLTNLPYHQIFWTSDGTEAGTVSYTNPDLSFPGASAGSSVDLNGEQFFVAKRGVNPRQWYRSDGTGGSLQPLMTGLTQDHAISAERSVVAGDLLFYAGRGTAGGDSGYELWATDGTAGGSRLVKDINPGIGWSDPAWFFAVGSTVYFAATSPGHGMEVWKSDGTEAGTVMVADLDPGDWSSDPEGFKMIGGKLHFTAYTRALGREMYTLEVE
ncbi:hypothetical protein OJ996_22245 [Luteolibacter sp. GHJ8]|uniref:ELWxxDGT repeat protein n=1 Tax=Luteolibacter rhizosphaerae TaxID=2989719 RepID=A0ABT3G900_9BACT|nr:hypothetical protein [Luteolibacter rhizosphaerae]MCW1916326.1 hypothetical protein [Luteolibacter rhizosphaerae]